MNDGEHLLICLLEECAEVQKAIAKALRFGLDDGQPGADTNNAQDIARECLDVIAIIELLEEADIIVKDGTIQAIEQKKARVRHYMEYARGRGMIIPPSNLSLSLRQLRERLKGIEWHVSRGVTQMEYQCNVCGGHKHYGGHKVDCWLANEISELGAE